MVKTAAILCLLLLSVIAANTTNWYVDRSASGGNDGTSWTDAWTNTTAIVWGSLSAGDTVYLSGGTTGEAYSAFTTGSGGTDGNPLTLQWSSEANHNGLVTITSVVSIANPYVVLDGVHYSHLKIECVSATSGAGSTYSSVSVMDNGYNFQLRNCYLIGYWGGTGSTCSYGTRATNTAITGCVFNHSVWEDFIFNNTSGGTFILANNIFSNNISDDPGVHRDVWNPEPGSGDLTFIATNNIFIDLDYCLSIQNKGSKWNTVTVAYNAAYNIYGMMSWFSGNLGCTTLNFYNNTIHNEGYQQEWNPTDPDVISPLGNLGAIDTINKTNNLWRASDSVSWRTDGAVDIAPNVINADNVLGADGVAYTADDGFDLNAGSPCINGGMDVGFSSDIRGVAITGLPDIGAYEYVTNSTLYPIINVGTLIQR